MQQNLKELVARNNTLIIVITEVKPKNAFNRTIQDITIQGYTLHQTNLDSPVFWRQSIVLTTCHFLVASIEVRHPMLILKKIIAT